MSIKRYVTLIISNEPIDLGGLDLEVQNEVEHLIIEEVEVESDVRGNMIVMKPLPTQTLADCGIVFRGIGNASSVAITDWLRNVCSSGMYDPLRNRRRRDADRKKEKEKEPKTAHLARGSVTTGGQVWWLNPKLCDRAATEASQEAHIRDHGAGPFEVLDIRIFRGGELTLICFEDQHGKSVEMGSDWLAAD